MTLKEGQSRINVAMPTDLIETLKKRTEDSQRSVNKEIVWIIQQFLKQEHTHESTKKI